MKNGICRRVAIHDVRVHVQQSADAALDHPLKVTELAENDDLLLLATDFAKYIDQPPHLRVVLEDLLDRCTLGLGNVEGEGVGNYAAKDLNHFEVLAPTFSLLELGHHATVMAQLHFGNSELVTPLELRRQVLRNLGLGPS